MVPTSTKLGTSFIQALGRGIGLRYRLISFRLGCMAVRPELIPFFLKSGDPSILRADLTLELESRRF
ncbi:Hypothetical protein PHPALM_10989 [Phytophthora palmivora]|uniref:Uncharacterized protein n=1 Tax=Phytophthora palmivora TaxID=4796 RepID=A0A2P4Y3F9_9STRA|nr:Hypothetical protein PHPALM_10989 [Phytophthora palmivora]